MYRERDTCVVNRHDLFISRVHDMAGGTRYAAHSAHSITLYTRHTQTRHTMDYSIQYFVTVYLFIYNNPITPCSKRSCMPVIHRRLCASRTDRRSEGRKCAAAAAAPGGGRGRGRGESTYVHLSLSLSLSIYIYIYIYIYK